MPRLIKITKVRLSKPSAGVVQCVISHREGLTGAFTIDVAAVAVQPDGSLLQPIYLGPFAEGSTVAVRAKRKGGRLEIERQITIPLPVTTTTTTEEIVMSWRGGAWVCATEKSCPPGYTLSLDGTTCSKIETVAPVSQEQPIQAATQNNPAYSSYGTRVYNADFDLAGVGSFTQIPAANAFWRYNGQSEVGPMNRSGIWVDADGDGVVDALAWGKELTVTFNVMATEEKIFYFGVGGDNQVKLTVNGTVVVNKEDSGNADNFKWWHIYPVRLNAGSNLVSVSGKGDGSVSDSVAMEIYNNTKEEIIAATSAAQLNILYSTQQVRGGSLQITTCPAGYQAINNNGVWQCQRVLAVPATVQNTGALTYTTRQRLRSGIPDGYEEANALDSGIGPYVAGEQNTDKCPLS